MHLILILLLSLTSLNSEAGTLERLRQKYAKASAIPTFEDPELERASKKINWPANSYDVKLYIYVLANKIDHIDWQDAGANQALDEQQRTCDRAREEAIHFSKVAKTAIDGVSAESYVEYAARTNPIHAKRLEKIAQADHECRGISTLRHLREASPNRVKPTDALIDR